MRKVLTGDNKAKPRFVLGFAFFFYYTLLFLGIIFPRSNVLQIVGVIL
jgi:hypothetical protein